jgi:peptidylprolyl isomerase
VAGKDRRRQIARERYERRLQERAAARAKARQRMTIGGSAAAVVAIVAIVLAVVLSGGNGKDAASASSPIASGSSAPSSAPPPPPPTHAAGCTTKPSVVASPIANFPILPAGVDPALKTEPTITIPEGSVPITLQTKDLIVGKGETVQADDSVTMNYLGVNYVNCEEFDSSWSRNQTATFSLQGVVPGFAQGVTGMKVGGRREIIIPPSLGYGASGSGGVGPNEELVFVVDVLATTHSSSASPSGAPNPAPSS